MANIRFSVVVLTVLTVFAGDGASIESSDAYRDAFAESAQLPAVYALLDMARPASGSYLANIKTALLNLVDGLDPTQMLGIGTYWGDDRTPYVQEIMPLLVIGDHKTIWEDAINGLQLNSTVSTRDVGAALRDVIPKLKPYVDVGSVIFLSGVYTPNEGTNSEMDSLKLLLDNNIRLATLQVTYTVRTAFLQRITLSSGGNYFIGLSTAASAFTNASNTVIQLASSPLPIYKKALAKEVDLNNADSMSFELANPGPTSVVFQSSVVNNITLTVTSPGGVPYSLNTKTCNWNLGITPTYQCTLGVWALEIDDAETGAWSYGIKCDTCDEKDMSGTMDLFITPGLVPVTSTSSAPSISTTEPTKILTTESTVISTTDSATIPTTEPTTIPSTELTTIPSTELTTIPTTELTTIPSTELTTIPTTELTTIPTTETATIPTAESTVISTTEPTTIQTTEPTTIPTTEPTTIPATELTTIPTTESTTISTTELTTIPTTETATIPTAESTVISTTEPTTIQTTEPTTIPTTEPTTIPTTEPTTIPTTEPTTIPTTEPTTIPTTEPTTIPTTEPTTIPTTEPTTIPTTEPTTIPTTEPTTIPTTEPTTVPSTEPTMIPTTISTTEATTIPSTERTTIPTTSSSTEETTTVTEPTTKPTITWTSTEGSSDFSGSTDVPTTVKPPFTKSAAFIGGVTGGCVLLVILVVLVVVCWKKRSNAGYTDMETAPALASLSDERPQTSWKNQAAAFQPYHPSRYDPNVRPTELTVPSKAGYWNETYEKDGLTLTAL